MEGRNRSEANLQINWTPDAEAIETGRSVVVYDNRAGHYEAPNPFQTLENGFASAYEETRAMPSPIHGMEHTDNIQPCCCKWYVRSLYFDMEITYTFSLVMRLPPSKIIGKGLIPKSYPLPFSIR